jgi:hypothetical protein
MTTSGPNRAKSGTHSKVQVCSKNQGLGHNDTASDVSKQHVLPPNQTVRAKYIQESILSLFLPDEMNKTGDTGKVTERRFMKTCWI